MREAAANLEFELAARLRDELKRLQAVELAIGDDPLARQTEVEEIAGTFGGARNTALPPMCLPTGRISRPIAKWVRTILAAAKPSRASPAPAAARRAKAGQGPGRGRKDNYPDGRLIARSLYIFFSPASVSPYIRLLPTFLFSIKPSAKNWILIVSKLSSSM